MTSKNPDINLALILLIYILIINLIGLSMMGIDKYKAKIKAWRIPESNLFLIAIVGGSIGSLAGMFIFRHKTKHWSFLIGMPLIIVIQLALIIWLYFFSPIKILVI